MSSTEGSPGRTGLRKIMEKRLSELINKMPVLDTIKGDTHIPIRGITKDSRKVEEGFLFFSTDSSGRHAGDALRRGAVAVITEKELPEGFPCSIIVKDAREALGWIAARFYDFPSRDMIVAGITGTNGKTTTTYLMESILKEARKKTGVIGTISHRYGDLMVKAENTTPGAEELQRLLYDMRGVGIDSVVMEVSSHALHQKRVECVDFDVAMFTNLTRDHLDYHGTFEEYKDAKKIFFEYHIMKSKKENKFAVLNMDDPASKGFVPPLPVKTLYYSLSKGADASLSGYVEDITGLNIDCSLMGEEITLSSPLVGLFNISNILAAVLFGRAINLSTEDTIKGVENMGGVPGRLERVKNDKGFYVFIDYAHTPDALKNVMETLNRLKRGRLVVVFGCGGDRDRGKRPAMGGIASGLADFSIITSDNPRGEEPGRIIRDIAMGFGNGPYRAVENRRDAIGEGLKMCGEDDVLLIAGKGHEDYQVIGDRVYHFSDREVVEEYLNVARQ